MPRRNFAQTINVSRMPAHMNGNNGLRARSDRGFNEVGINAIRLAQDVHHDGHGARKQNCAESSAFVFVVLRPCGKRFALGLRSAEQGKLGHSFLWNELYSDTEPARPGRLLFDVMTLS